MSDEQTGRGRVCEADIPSRAGVDFSPLFLPEDGTSAMRRQAIMVRRRAKPLPRLKNPLFGQSLAG